MTHFFQVEVERVVEYSSHIKAMQYRGVVSVGSVGSMEPTDFWKI